MKSLAALFKFLGLYDERKILVRKDSLKWNSRSSKEAFVFIFITWQLSFPIEKNNFITPCFCVVKIQIHKRKLGRSVGD